MISNQTVRDWSRTTSALLLSLVTIHAIESRVRANEPSDFAVQAAAAADSAEIPDTFGRAKNVILFVGDGMGVSTVTAARILDGQNRGEMGEENVLFFETFPYTAMSKTYAINMQTPDSASTMTAMVTGHKTKGLALGYDRAISTGDYASTEDAGGPSKRLSTLLEQFEAAGKKTGLVSTTSLTHATPAACYAHSPVRWWTNGNYRSESRDGKPNYEEAVKAGFKDVARQFVEFPFGDGVDVAFAGGYSDFLPEAPKDANGETAPKYGSRIDGRNLVDEWLGKPNRDVVWNRTELLDLNLEETGQALGLFSSGNMTFEADIQESDQERTAPRLSEMAVTALKLLRRDGNGFFLMVEGGRIDHGHHAASAKRALTEATEFNDAVKAVYETLTEHERKETLIVVTADHSHVFVLSGYPGRGNPILGKVNTLDPQGRPTEDLASDSLGLPYTTLGYHNGPGFPGARINTETLEEAVGFLPDSGDWEYLNLPRPARPDLTHEDTEALHYHQETAIPMSSETHGGEDVTIYATGPGSHMFRGTREQNFIYHAIRRALDGPNP